MTITSETANLGKVWRAYESIIDADHLVIDVDHLEDRREYDNDQLGKMYGLNPFEASYLGRLIHTHFDPESASLYRSHWTPEDADNLATTITESIHEGFDGWDDHEKVIIQLYLHDIGIALKAIGDHSN